MAGGVRFAADDDSVAGAPVSTSSEGPALQPANANNDRAEKTIFRMVILLPTSFIVRSLGARGSSINSTRALEMNAARRDVHDTGRARRVETLLDRM
jgi:hypothetical protein